MEVNDFLIIDGVRHVSPYERMHILSVKQRWVGLSAIDALSREYARLDRESWLILIQGGNMTVAHKNNSSIIINDPEYKLCANDKLTIREHSHEPPSNVPAGEVNIISQNEHIVVVSKPSSIPVHPGGPYNKNTLIYILETENKLGQLKPVHRLDRLTSGLCFLARTKLGANLMQYFFSQRKIKKQYLARVRGQFHISDADIEKNNIKLVDAKESGLHARYIVSAPIFVLRQHSGDTLSNLTCSLERKQEHLNKNLRVNELYAETHFKVLQFDKNGNTTLLLCSPITGRPHQIRAHLELLGFPIANDPFHSGELYSHNAYRPAHTSYIQDTSKHKKRCTSSSRVLSMLQKAYESECPNCNMKDNIECKLNAFAYYHFTKPRIHSIWLHAYRCKFDISDIPDKVQIPGIQVNDILNVEYEAPGPEWTSISFDASKFILSEDKLSFE